MRSCPDTNTVDPRFLGLEMVMWPQDDFCTIFEDQRKGRKIVRNVVISTIYISNEQTI